MTIAALCSIGLQIIGQAVLFIMRGMPKFFPISVTSPIWKTLSDELEL